MHLFRDRARPEHLPQGIARSVVDHDPAIEVLLPDLFEILAGSTSWRRAWSRSSVSLHAQREAGLAYIASQRSEGWIALPDHYDDGGISGGTLERPALKRLLRDVEAELKIDRLSRSLTDFARLVDIFERHNVTFVSVTQQFNTTTSMGRLTLNILLSFAQFEREVICERIRDKFAAQSAQRHVDGRLAAARTPGSSRWAARCWSCCSAAPRGHLGRVRIFRRKLYVDGDEPGARRPPACALQGA